MAFLIGRKDAVQSLPTQEPSFLLSRVTNLSDKFQAPATTDQPALGLSLITGAPSTHFLFPCLKNDALGGKSVLRTLNFGCSGVTSEYGTQPGSAWLWCPWTLQFRQVLCSSVITASCFCFCFFPLRFEKHYRCHQMQAGAAWLAFPACCLRSRSLKSLKLQNMTSIVLPPKKVTLSSVFYIRKDSLLLPLF